ncbi:MAG: DNA packaging protein, partial [Xanthomonadales bacterium]|nr:DNA packaging protein [Xanthomonadales bacterium]
MPIAPLMPDPQALFDKGWRLNNLYKIKDVHGHSVHFKMNWAQQEMFENLWYNNIVLKSRKPGISTLVNLLQLDDCLFQKNFTAAVIAHELDSAEKLFENHVRFPFEALPQSLREAITARRDSARALAFSNGSRLDVATSVRSGTVQFLHVSEFGKICAKYPDKAKEIVTGSLEAVGQSNVIVIESTAEGAEGYFYDYCQEAMALRDQIRAGILPKLSLQDFRFFFFPWWRKPDNRLPPEGVVITDELAHYFEAIETKLGMHLDPAQRAWYAKKHARLGERMFQEHPSTESECFQHSLEGTYYAAGLAQARREGRIKPIPFDPAFPVNTFWDLGVDDYTAIWLHQQVARVHRFCGYIEANGEGLNYYLNELERWRRRGAVFGTHYFPHDAQARRLSINAPVSIAEDAMRLGLKPLIIVPASDLLAGIQRVRHLLYSCEFDQPACALGLKRLEHYRKAWDATLGVYKPTPRHDEASHGADAFRYFATGYVPARPLEPLARRLERHSPA